MRQSVASEWPRGAKGAPRCPKRCQKGAKNTSRGTPGHAFLAPWAPKAHLCKTSVFYCVKPTFAPPGGLLLNTRATHSDVPGALTAKRDTKVMQKVPRGTPRERPGWPPWRPGCQKVSKKVTENDHKLHHLATDCPKAVPGGPREPFGVPPSWQNVLPAGWLAGWLAGWPAGCLAGWLGLPCLKPQKISF